MNGRNGSQTSCLMSALKCCLNIAVRPDVPSPFSPMVAVEYNCLNSWPALVIIVKKPCLRNSVLLCNSPFIFDLFSEGVTVWHW